MRHTAAMMGLINVVGLFAILGLSACEEPRSCQNSCSRAFRADNCAFGAGILGDDAIRNCVTECRQALRQNGELGSYDPDDYNSVDRSRAFELENEAQAAAWIDCVAETSCEDINDGFCPGGGIN